MGVLKNFDVEMIGATAAAIDKAEDRELFREAMTKIGLATPRSHHIKTLSGALAALEDIGLPAIIRPSFTLGGTGGGIAYNKAEFIEIVERGIDASPTNEVLVEESVLGWKEYEMEVVRDKADNCIIVCSIENLDPMACIPEIALRLRQPSRLRIKNIKSCVTRRWLFCARLALKQVDPMFIPAIDPQTGRMIVIVEDESRASPALLRSPLRPLGFRLLKVAAKLAVGYRLDEIAN